jgi:hypothetical protein
MGGKMIKNIIIIALITIIVTDKDKVCIYGVGTAVSPDLNLSIEKAKMIAKAELADIIKGEMNKQSKQFVTELGKTTTKDGSQ